MPTERATSFVACLADGLRATFLRRPRNASTMAGPGTFVAAAAFYLALETLAAWIDADAPRAFVGYGVVTVLADALLTLVAAWLMIRVLRRDGIGWGVAAVALIATALTARLVHWPLGHVTEYAYSGGHVDVALGLGWLSRLWWLLVLIALARWLAPRPPARALVAAVLAFVVSAVTWWWLPGMPVFVHDARAAAAQQAPAQAEVTSEAQASAAPAFDAEHVLYDQPRLLAESIAALQPRSIGRSNLFVLAFAGDASEDVFRNEVEYVERLFAARFAAGGRTIVLQNHAETLDLRPLASLSNLRVALDAIAVRMDPAEDILFLYLTSHGSEDHQLYVNLDPLPLNQIRPEDLADALQTTPSIRWKVLVVNACYAGGFIESLRDDSTLVIAAARRDRTSFGCGSESDITYFGKAFLAEALNETTSIPQAFERARKRIAEWEANDDAVEEHSEPQIASTRSIEARLERWSAQLGDGPRVPFVPARSSGHASDPPSAAQAK